MRKRWLMSGVGVAVAAVAVAVWTGRDGLVQAAKPAKPAAVPLEFAPREVVQPVLAAMPTVIEFSGPLVAPSTAIVRAKAGGTLLALDVGEGSRVKAGQRLATLDVGELASRVAERRAMLESAKAQLAQAERTHATNQRLADQQFISSNALDSSRAALETARAQALAAQAQLESTQVGLRDAALVAPISGVVAKRHVVPGEKLSPDQQILTIVDLAKLELAGTVGTHEVSRLAAGMPVQVRIEGQDRDVGGTLARIAPAAEPGTRSIGVTIALANPREEFRAGQYALARVVLADPVQRLSLPLSAVINTAGQDNVWVIENGALMRRAVITGRRDERERRVEVLSGVDTGSQVLAARFDNLREGAKAVVTPRAAPIASATASSAVTAR